jgi:hypothetical protein
MKVAEDTRPNPVTFATDAHDALAAVTSQQIIPEDRQSLRIYRPNGPKRRRSVWHLSPVRGPKSTRIVDLREMHAVGSGGLDAVKSHTCKNQSSKANMPVYFTGSTNGLTTVRSAGQQGWRR